jgi:uncharacterized membrane protein YccC
VDAPDTPVTKGMKQAAGQFFAVFVALSLANLLLGWSEPAFNLLTGVWLSATFGCVWTASRIRE